MCPQSIAGPPMDSGLIGPAGGGMGDGRSLTYTADRSNGMGGGSGGACCGLYIWISIYGGSEEDERERANYIE